MEKMSNFIRDFTLIDLMGILFPGSVLLLLLQIDFSIWDKIENVWGCNPNTAVRVALILIGGYFIGNILMELGDIWEYLIWKNPLLNPRGWAAHSTGLLEREMETVKVSKCCIHFAIWLGGVLLGAIIFAILFFSGIIRLLGQYIPLMAWHWCVWCALCLILPAIICYILNIICNKRFSSDCLKKLVYIEKNDFVYMVFLPRAQSQLDEAKKAQSQNNDTLKSKQTLFDGFRIMSRNILFVFILICAYGMHSDKTLHDYYQKLTTNTTGCSILFATFLLLFMRYWRFSYLKYKYYYEVYVNYD